MGDLELRQAIAAALEVILKKANSREEALANAEAEILEMLNSSEDDLERAALLSIVNEEIVKVRMTKY